MMCIVLAVLFSFNIISREPVAGTNGGRIIPAAERMDIYLPYLRGKSVAVFANQSSMVGNVHLVDTLLALHIHIQKIFSPEHGFRGTADAGEQVNNARDARTGIPIVSLYGNKVKPSAEDLKNVDVMLFDIQDVGVRFYTYIASLQEYIEAAMENNKPLIILDRPNPNGFYVDGPVLDTAFRSFVGMQPVPVVYGMTLAEYSLMLLGEKWVHGEVAPAIIVDTTFTNHEILYASRHLWFLYIVRCAHYTHNSRYRLPVKPSPNLPNMQSIYLYPSLCFFEGTVISLGRGTDKPFQQFGHPSFPKNLYHFQPHSTEGAKNPPLQGQVCYGYDLSGNSVPEKKDGHLQLQWLLKAYAWYPDKKNFFLSSGFFNKLAGSDVLMQQIKSNMNEKQIRQSWEPALSQFKKIRKKYLLYPDFN